MRDFMSRDVVTLEEGDLCVDAYQLLRAHRLRRAPVVSEGRLVGMISDRDLLRALPWSHGDAKEIDRASEAGRTVEGYMARRIHHVTPETRLEDVACLMLEHKIGGLPVLDGQRLVGIISESDLLRVFLRLRLETMGTHTSAPTPASGTQADASAPIRPRPEGSEPEPGPGRSSGPGD
ncbi:MAG: CBS domain-containing protein [Planctomycetota bacterium]